MKKLSTIKEPMINILIALISICVTLFFAEIAYRYRLYLNNAFQNQYKFRVGSFVYGVFDDKYGVKYPPKTTFTLFNITNGKVTWCPEAISISNEDGINGKTTIAEYNRAEFKILVFGDSFTHWNQEGYTWPDILEEILSKHRKNNVRVLNYGRGTYGILQMFDLAADKVLEHQPDLVLIAFVSDDLTRDRWWTKPFVIDGYERPLLSPNKTDFDLSIASDEYLVNSFVDLQWCRQSMASNDANPILNDVMEQYHKIRESTFKQRGIHENTLFSIRHSYLYNRLISGHAFSSQSRPTIPRISYDAFTQDKQCVDKIKMIESTEVPYILFHVPVKLEIEHSTAGLKSEQQKLLMQSLQTLTNDRVIFLHQYIDQTTVPDRINLEPHDGHPSYDGLQLYAETIATYLIKNSFIP